MCVGIMYIMLPNGPFPFKSDLCEMEREPQISMTVDDYDAATDSDCESSSASAVPQFGDFATNGMVRVEVDQAKYAEVERMFRDGMGVLGQDVNVVALHKASYSTLAGHARLEAFRLYSNAAAMPILCMLGTEVHEMRTHGFWRCGDFEDGLSNGIGVYLSPANFPVDCAVRAKEDEFGVKHLLLCRVILGNTEKIAAGSRQFQPSSTHFDSGVENLIPPLQYTICGAYMNSHILPTFSFSFTAPTFKVSGTSNLSYSKRVEFDVVMNVVSRFLRPSQVISFMKCCNDFQEKKISRPFLIAILKSLAGDQVLLSLLRICKFRLS